MNDTTTIRPDLDCPERGGMFAYDRPARHDKDGSINFKQLRDDEVIVWPGMIYRKKP